MGINDPYWAFCFDSAAWEYTAWLESMLDTVAESTPGNDPKMRQEVRQQFLNTAIHYDPYKKTEEKEEQATKGRFRDPAEVMKERARK